MPETKANALPPQLREQFDKAKQAFNRNNLDYAVTLLENVLRQKPSCYEAREALRASQVKRHGGKKGFLKKMLGTASGSSTLAKAQIALRTNPVEALAACESILSSDPNSVLAHKTLAQAAMACEFPRTAVLSLEIAYRSLPLDKDTALRLSEALIATGNTPRAEDILKKSAAEHRNDPEVLQALKDATAKRTLGEGGYEKITESAGSFRDILKDEEEAVRLEDQDKQVKSESSIQRLAEEYKRKLANDPEDLKLVHQLADLYRKAGDFQQALSLFEQLAASDQGANLDLHQVITELKLEQFDADIAQLDPASDTYEAEYQEILRCKEAFEFENCMALASRFPTDLSLRLKLGQHFLKQGKLTKAIKEFQRAQGNAHIKTHAQRLLAECFSRRSMLDLAERTLKSAIKEKAMFDDEKKELLYDLGIVLEKSAKGGEAIEQFKLIFEVDIDFKDVAERVDRYYSNP
ncbi:MAG: Beta-barrel assembly-enhancing protease [Verrucomicrobia subdivision 3 bacterium]|nr:Beta-barrel assembly-enhancing protease [Limisphaerales bacterium]MCS1412719.1 Beta-barrel assembly-enhancing protease [Limisphaerales bacterium]